MLKIWDAENFRRTLTAICLIGAPLFFAAAGLISPPEMDRMDPASILAQISQYHDREMIMIVLSTIAAILFIPLAVGLIHILSERGVDITSIFSKLQVPDRAQTIVKARDAGFG